MRRKSGILPYTGYSYQDYVGILRMLNFITEPKLKYFEFESEGEILEDVNSFYVDRAVYEQVKYKEHDDWRPHELKSVMDKFLRQKGSENCSLVFTTNTKGDATLTEIDVIRRGIQQGDYIEPSADQIKLFRTCFNDGVEDSAILWVMKRIDFRWNEFRPDPSDPLDMMLEECVARLRSLCGLSDDDSKAAILSLLGDIKRWSSRRYGSRHYTLSPFRKIIPDCGRIGFGLLEDMLPSETVQTIAETSPLRVIRSLRKTIGGESVNVPAIIIFEGVDVHLWTLRHGVLENEIRRVDRIIDRTQGLHHLVIGMNEGFDPNSLSQLTRDSYVAWNDTERLKKLLEGMKNAGS